MRKRIAVILPELCDILETELVSGIHETAKTLGYDVIILTDTYNAISDSYATPYMQGQESIYHLLSAASFDGVIFAAGRFHRVAMCEQIAALLQEKQIPCVVLDERMEGMETVYAEHEEGVRLITKHLIEDHGFTNIAFDTLPEGSVFGTDAFAALQAAAGECALYVSLPDEADPAGTGKAA